MSAVQSGRARALHLWTLSSFALAQPLYDLLGSNPEFFIVRQSNLATVTFLILVLSFAAPAAPALVQALVRRLHGATGRSVHLALVFALTGMALLPPLNRLDLSAGLTAGSAAVGGVVFAAAYARFDGARVFVSFLSPAILLFPLAFLLFSPVLATISDTGVPPDLPAPRLEGPVVMVVFDELPLISLLDENHRIDAGRFPSFARLADTSTWYPNARTISGSTPHSLTMMLTGRRTPYGELPVFSRRPKNLFTLLGGAGPISALESATRLCPPALCDRSARSLRISSIRHRALLNDLGVVYLHLLLPRQWRHWLPPIGDNWVHFVLRGQESKDYDERPQTFARFVQEISAADPPGLNFIHTFLPHVPWAYLPDGRSYSLRPWLIPGFDAQQDRWSPNPWLVAQGYRRHLLQVQFADRLLGELLDRLVEIGVFDSSLIVVVSDHGCNFVAGRRRRALVEGRELDLFAVPLLIKSPGQNTGEIDAAPLRNEHILGEIASILGMSEAWGRPRAPRPKTPAPWPDPNWPGNESLREKINLFGGGAGPFPAGGPRPEWLGRPSDQLPDSVRSGFEVNLTDPELFQRVDLDASFLPLLVQGHVKLPENPNRETAQLALAVNGTVRALTETYRRNGAWHAFSAMLSPGDLRQGENRIQVFLVDAALAGESPNPSRSRGPTIE